MERAASVAHSTQSERPQRPEGMYRKLSSMPGSDWQAPPTVDQYMGRSSLHGRSASTAAIEPSFSTDPIALPVDVQVNQALCGCCLAHLHLHLVLLVMAFQVLFLGLRLGCLPVHQWASCCFLLEDH